MRKAFAGKNALPLVFILAAVSACAQADEGAKTPERKVDQAFLQLADRSAVKRREYTELSVAGVTIASGLQDAAGRQGRMGSAAADDAGLAAHGDPFLTAGQLREVKKTILPASIDRAAGERVYEAEIDPDEWKRMVESNWRKQLEEAEAEARAVPRDRLSAADKNRLMEARIHIAERVKERLTAVLPTMAAKPVCTIVMDRCSDKLLRMRLVTELTYTENGKTSSETIATTYDFTQAETGGQ